MLVKLLLLLSTATSIATTEIKYQNTIYVSVFWDTCNESCWVGGEDEPCGSLNCALKGAQHFENSVAIVLEPGDYYLLENSTNLTLSDFALYGEENNVTVNCVPNVGLVFVESTGIIISNVTFKGCGIEREETRAGIHFFSCYNVSIISSQIVASQGTGVALHFGQTTVPDSSGDRCTSGSGVYAEFTQLEWEDHSSGLSPLNTSGSFVIRKCHFISNGMMDNTKLEPQRPNDIPSVGGGVSIYFTGSAQNNNVVFEECTFVGNSARGGGGMLIQFEDDSKDNTITIRSTKFTSNRAYNVQRAGFDPGIQSRGGAVEVILNSGGGGNRAVFDRCNFTGNLAYLGGGISVSVTSSWDDVQMTNCTFQQNHARYGAAIDLFGYQDEMKLFTTVAIRDCQFLLNGIPLEKKHNKSFSVVGIDHLVTTFQGKNTFKANRGTPVMVKDINVGVSSFSTLTFVNNMAYNGGAMAFSGSGHMVVHSGTHLLFQSNSATEKGGAIYSDQFNEHFTLYSQQCFIRYYNSSTHPNNWNTTVFFSDNYAAGERNSILVASLIPCAWPISGNSTIQNDLEGTFCWDNWNYSDSHCGDEVITSPAYFKQSSIDLVVFPGRSALLPLQAFDELQKNLSDHTTYIAIPENTSLPSTYITDNTITIYGNSATTGDETNLTIRTTDARVLQAEVHVDILPCPPGFIHNKIADSSFSCVCGQGFRTLGIQMVICKPSEFRSYMELGNCMTFDEGSNQPILARCPYFTEYALKDKPLLTLPRNLSALDESICGPLNRKGKLCSHCSEGYGISAISYGFVCVRCSPTPAIGWLKYIVAKFLPVTIFFLFIMAFKVSVTSPPLNSYIFFSQVVTLPREVLVLQTALALFSHNDGREVNAFVTPYSIWNLDFFRIVIPEFCVEHELRALNILAIEYIVAIYPLLLIGLTYVCIQLHGRDFKPIVWVWKPFQICFRKARKNWNSKTSTIDAIAAFLLLSYTKFIYVSLTLLTPTDVINDAGEVMGSKVLWYDGSIHFFQAEHLYYAIPAIVILILASIPVFLLLLYPFRFFQKCLGFFRLRSLALNTFVEAFQGCYKDGTDGTPDRRYFAGIYFIFRIIIFSLFAAVVDISVLYMVLLFIFTIGIILIAILQPYKKNIYNQVDVLIFGLLVFVHALFFYIYLYFRRSLIVSTPAIALLMILLLLPLLCITAYVLIWLVSGKVGWRQRLDNLSERVFNRLPNENRNDSMRRELIETYNHSEEGVASVERTISGFSTESIPDRILNPHEYALYTDD